MVIARYTSSGDEGPLAVVVVDPPVVVVVVDPLVVVSGGPLVVVVVDPLDSGGGWLTSG